MICILKLGIKGLTPRRGQDKKIYNKNNKKKIIEIKKKYSTQPYSYTILTK